MSTTLRLVATVAAVVVALVSCGEPTATVPPAPAAHGVPDVAFARNMIPHHRQAVVLAAMVPAHTGNSVLRQIATQIGADQQAEIRTLDGLLAAWGEPPPAEHGAMAMAGMVDQPTMDRLATLDDDAFDTLWVTSMIGHHEGAITMAQDEVQHGRSADAVHVAQLVISAQQREISMMTHLISLSQ